MSMNLTCSVSGKEVHLWQTPTHITWMCLSMNEKTRKPDGGMEGVRRRYLFWVESHTHGVWKSSEELAEMKRSVQEHTNQIRKLVRPKFSFR